MGCIEEKRNDVQRMVENEEGPEMKRLDQVEGWLSKVEALEPEVEQLIFNTSTQEMEMTCLSGCCPRKCKSSYKLGKKVAQMLKELADLRSKADFDVMVGRVPLAPVDERLSEPTVGMESTFDEAWRCIRDDKVGTIGLYGMGGVGKTTLLTEINNKLATTSHDFNVVIWVLVSKNPSIHKVQEEIGKKIGYHENMWTNKSHNEKAEDIFKVLKEKKFVLLLDDIWKRVDLKQVGVLLPSKKNQSKVVFTTRSEDVCGRMEAQKKVRVKCLARDDAWNLFKKKVGEDTLNADPEILELARLVANKCDGLPLALITIGRAMACKKTPQEWSYAMTMLDRKTAMFSGMGDEVFPLLKFSYDSLPSDTVRSCFLYCSLFPRDSYIPRKKLIDYWFCEGFLDAYTDIDGAKNQGYDIIGTLIHACLLEEDAIHCVKMHDVIRDMALWIACDCGMARGKYVLQSHAGLTEAHIRKWNQVERISLMSNHIEKLTEAPSCHNLLTLFLNDNRLKMIAGGFFQSMRALRVLDLSHNGGLTGLPNEVSLLVSLQYLNLSGTSVGELPIELKNLVRLKFLDLTYTECLRYIPWELISSFRKLQVLKMFGCGARLFGSVETLVEEYWNDLHYLTVTLHGGEHNQNFLSSAKLMRCITRLGFSYQWGMGHPIPCLDLSILERMQRLERLEITGFDLDVHLKMGIMTYSEIVRHCRFHSLRSVFIVRCPNILNLSWLHFAPNLELLSVAYCSSLNRVLINIGATVQPFARLKELYLIELPELRSVYYKPMPFPCLKYIGVEGCPLLKELPLDSTSAMGCGLTIQGDYDWWNDLKWKGEASFCLFDQKGKTKIKNEHVSSSSSSTADKFIPYLKAYD